MVCPYDNIDAHTRVSAIQHWKESGSVQDTASAFGVHRKTLRRWIRWYRTGGAKQLNREEMVRRHPRRIAGNLEKRIVALKERNPGISLAAAKALLAKEGLSVSEKGIWSIWKRFGMTGFRKDRFSTSYREYLSPPAAIEKQLKGIGDLIERGKSEQVAQTINSLPAFPYPEILMKIPEGLLSLNRKLDRLSGAFGALPLSEYYRKAKSLREKLEHQGRFYSSLRAGIEEGYALIWLGEPAELLELSKHLKKRAHRLRDPGMQFALLMFEGHALGSFLDIKGALRCAQKCKIIIRNFSHPAFFKGELAGLYSVLGCYDEAIELTRCAMEDAEGTYKKHLKASLAGFSATAGAYGEALSILQEEDPKGWDYQSRGMLIQAFALLDRGEFQEAASMALQALSQSEKEEIKRHLHLATFILACSHAAAGEPNESKKLLNKYNQLLRKHRLEKEYLLRKLLMGDTELPGQAWRVPNLRLTFLLKKANETGYANDYRLALRYARSKKLFGLFERLALFFPKPVKQLLRKRKETGLSRAFIRMPVFQLDPPVYHLKFLGKPQLFKGKKQLRRLHLSPKERAFLIAIATSKNRSIPLDRLYANYWPKSSNPARNLSHLLVRIRTILALPSYLMSIQDEHLVWDCYFTTDYGRYLEHLAQGKALLRAGEWGFAKREFLQAFSLFRGEPFRKMYDNWSDDRRLEILFSYETRVIAFARELFKRGRKEEAHRLLGKAQKILTDSDEIEALLD